MVVKMLFTAVVRKKYSVVASDLTEEMAAIHEDYGIVKHEIEKEATIALNEIAHLLPWPKEKVHLVMVKTSKGKLGLYRSGTESNPIIILNPRLILNSAKKYGVERDTMPWHRLCGMN